MRQNPAAWFRSALGSAPAATEQTSSSLCPAGSVQDAASGTVADTLVDWYERDLVSRLMPGAVVSRSASQSATFPAT